MNSNLLVTLADKNYLNQAKQLFSSVYWNAGWKGDYMLLAHDDVPEEDLDWFRKKGILIYQDKSIAHPLYKGKCSPVVFQKIYLFHPTFKKWEHIIFIDSDCIVQASIDKLTKKKGFCAVKDAFSENLAKEFTTYPKSLKNSYNIRKPVFNSGVLVIETKKVPPNAFEQLIELNEKYGKYARYGEQSILNLYWWKKWNPLPQTYNTLVNHNWYRNKPKNFFNKAVILHFAWKEKPWSLKSPFYQIWEENLKRSEKLSLSYQTIPVKKSLYTIYLFGISLKIAASNWKIKKRAIKIIKVCIQKISRFLFLVGRIIKKISPKIYYAIGGKN